MPARSAKSVSKMTLPFPKSDVRIQDCIKGMQSIDESSVDVVVTSPPYNLGVSYNSYMDTLEQAEYLKWCIDWTRGIRRVMKGKGSLFLNLGSSPSNPTIPHMLLYQIILDKQFVLQNTIHWIKAITVIDDDGNKLSKGHFKPINSERFVNDCHEYVFHLTPTGNTHLDRRAVGVEYKHKSNIGRWEHTKGLDKRCRGNTRFIPYETIQNRDKERPHPATFPNALPEQYIRLHGRTPSLVVMDPFLGIGSSWIAAIRCKVGKFIGFEIDKSYLRQAESYANDPTIVWPNNNQ